MSARAALVWLLAVLACLAAATSTAGIWAHEELLSTDRWRHTVERVAQDPEVAQAVSTRVSAEIVTALGIERRAREGLPERIQFLAPALDEATRELLQSQLDRLLRSEEFQGAWVQAMTIAHREAVGILRNQGTVVRADDGVVTLNLFALVEAGLGIVQRSGWLPPGISLPDLQGVTPDEGRQRLQSALGIQLPAQFGEIVLARSSELKRAQEAVWVFDRLVVVLPLVTLALIAGTIVAARDRRRTAIALGIALAGTLLLTYAVIRLLLGEAVNAVRSDPAGFAVAGDAAAAVLEQLRQFALIAAGAAAALAVAGALAGGVAIPAGVTSWVTRNAGALRLAGVVAAGGAFVLAQLSWGGLLAVLVLLVAFQAGLSLVAAAARRGPGGERQQPA